MKQVKYRLQCSVFAHHAMVDEQKKQDPKGPVFAVCRFAYFNNLGGRSCDDDDDDDAGTAAALPPSETYSRGGGTSSFADGVDFIDRLQ